MEVPRHWRLKQQRYALVGETCPRCKAHLFPPRPVCPHCAEAARQQASDPLQTAHVMFISQPAHTLGD